MREVGGEFDPPRGGTEPLQPAPEKYEPINFPYRGQEQHGVPAEQRPWIPHDATVDSWDGPDPIAEPAPEIEPVPVVIVTDSAREIRSWRAYQSAVSNHPNLLVGQNPNRTRARIRNLAAPNGDEVYIGHTSNVSSLDGYPIPPGEELVIETEEEIYVTVAPGVVNQVPVAVLVEHVVS